MEIFFANQESLIASSILIIVNAAAPCSAARFPDLPDSSVFISFCSPVSLISYCFVVYVYLLCTCGMT